MLKCGCCDLNLKYIDEVQRDTIMEKFANIANAKEKRSVVIEAKNYLESLNKAGYDVESLFNALQSYVMKYRISF
ncbi:MAG: hypothetical protein AABY07_08355 [Nanoarchaeota archaeon]